MTKFYTITEAAKATGLSRGRLQKFMVEESGINADVVKRIEKEKKTYISFREFAANKRGDRYDGSTYSKNKLLEQLEINEFYGVEQIPPDDLLLGQPKDVVFFRRTDIPRLESHLAPYFGLFALSEEDKVKQLLDATDRAEMRNCIRKYMDSYMFGQSIKPSFTEFITLALKLPDLSSVEDKDIQRVLTLPMTTTARNTLINFLNYARHHAKRVKYSQLKQAEQERKPIPAYSDDTYLALAKCIFNAEYIHEHKMIERALENPAYIEMWLYLALHFCCGWRAGDICRNWRYLRLHEKPDNPYGINAETLYDDILYDRLPDELYEAVCAYATKSIELSGQRPSKTAGAGAPPLVISIAPGLATFFGLLTLVAEAVMLRTGEGYMKPGRESLYQKRRMYRAFFGQEMFDVLCGRNIQSRRLNKDYLQGIEETSRQTGCGSLMASALASFARSHNNLDTIAHYLQDHTLSAENAEMVLYFMVERGVFGFEIYQTLLTACPDAIKKLPMREQNKLMAAVLDSPYMIELIQSGEAAKLEIQHCFENNRPKEVLGMLKRMYEISQGRGKGKDDGVHCLCRAGGKPCAFPEYDSCLANTCPHLVFTQYGYKALLEIIIEYKKAADDGNLKMASVLKNVIMPRFSNILNTLMREVNMRQNEKAGLQLMLKEALANGS